MLQNHPGYNVFPVTPWRVGELSERTRALVHAPGVLGALAILLGVFTIGLALEAPNPVPSVFVGGAATIAVGLCMLVVSVVLTRRACRAPVREQERYYELAGSRPLSAARRSALQLDGVNIGLGGWSETLEDWPAEVRLEGREAAFRTFEVCSKRSAIETLDQRWGVISSGDYRVMTSRLLTGMHSLQFARYSASPEFHALCERLGQLLDWEPERVAAAVRPRSSRPPALLWAFDLWRAIRLARDAFMAGLISEEDAWADILSLSALVHTLFGSLEEYHENLRLGHAFWSNDLQAVNERREVLEAFLSPSFRCPAAALPWPTGDVTLSSEMADGFAAFIAAEVHEARTLAGDGGSETPLH